MTLADFLPFLDALRRRGKASAVDAYAAIMAIGTRTEIIATAVTDYEQGATPLVGLPYDEVLATVRLIDHEDADPRKRGFCQRYYEDVDYPAELFMVLRAIERQLYDLHRLRLMFASQAMLTGALTNAFVPAPAPRIPYRLRQGDTLERIALETMRDITRSQDIIDLNDLEYPYLDTERSYLTGQFTAEFDPMGFQVGTMPDRTGVPDGVRVTAEVIYLPSDAVVPQIARLTDRDVELWGRDIRIGLDGYLFVDDTGEYPTIEAADNIVQALTQCLRVGQGELVLHPGYGMARLLAVGIEGTRENVLFSGFEVARTVRRDPRVMYVRDLDISFIGTTNRAGMYVGLIGTSQATIPLNLVIPESVVVS